MLLLVLVSGLDLVVIPLQSTQVEEFGLVNVTMATEEVRLEGRLVRNLAIILQKPAGLLLWGQSDQDLRCQAFLLGPCKSCRLLPDR